MDITYMTPKVVTAPVHKCYFLLTLEAGKIIAICRGCGKWIDYNEIQKRINDCGVR